MLNSGMQLIQTEYVFIKNKNIIFALKHRSFDSAYCIACLVSVDLTISGSLDLLQI
jgi:hypothetical protein